jgi:energy-converting hydrogenase Eha subunit A
MPACTKLSKQSSLIWKTPVIAVGTLAIAKAALTRRWMPVINQANEVLRPRMMANINTCSRNAAILATLVYLAGAKWGRNCG